MPVTPEQLEQKIKVGDQILDAFAVGSLGKELKIPGSAELQVSAANLWTNVFGAPPEVAGWVTPYESGSKKIALGKRVFSWLSSKTSQVAKTMKGKVGPAFKFAIGASLVAPLSYGAYVWMTDEDRQNARKMDAQKEAIIAATQIKDPQLQKAALDAISGIGSVPLGTLPWLAIIGGIAVVGIFFYKRKGA